MARQLSLLENRHHVWQLSDATRETGRRGVANARAELQRALAAARAAEAAKAAKTHPAHRRSAA